MITSEKAIESINRKISEMDSVLSHIPFLTWKKSLINTLINIFPETDRRVKEIEQMRSPYYYSNEPQTKTEERRKQFTYLLSNLVTDIESFGLPGKYPNPKEGLNIHVNQSNNQNQTTNVTINLDLILDAFRGELRSSEIEALKEILNSNREPIEKKRSFVEKLKSFGSDVASNILATILTNPQVYDQLGAII